MQDYGVGIARNNVLNSLVNMQKRLVNVRNCNVENPLKKLVHSLNDDAVIQVLDLEYWHRWYGRFRVLAQVVRQHFKSEYFFLHYNTCQKLTNQLQFPKLQ